MPTISPATINKGMKTKSIERAFTAKMPITKGNVPSQPNNMNDDTNTPMLLNRAIIFKDIHTLNLPDLCQLIKKGLEEKVSNRANSVNKKPTLIEA